MSSVRSRIDKFEALSRDQDDPSNKNTKKGKRFQFPGNIAQNDSDPSEVFISSNRSPKRQGLQNFEADLQEVWSVKKNIHHAGGHKNIASSNSSSGLLNNVSSVQGMPVGQYSRHGAIPAQPTRVPQVQPASKDHYNRGSTIHSSSEHESRRIPLQDFNSKESPWNVKKGGYSYNQQGSMDGHAKRSIGSPKTQGSSLLPAAKRRTSRGNLDGFRSSAADNTPATSFVVKNSQHDKVNYAKKMAQGYLRSVGMGEYTPTTSMYSKQPVKPSNSDSSSSASTVPATRWKRVEDDREFEFDDV